MEQGGWMARLDRARTGLQGHCSGEAAEEATEESLPTVRVAPKSTAGSPGTHLSLPFWTEDWPRLALSKSGEFLLRFVLVERTLFCEEWRATTVSQEPMSFPRTTGCPVPSCSVAYFLQ